jgi:CBS domain-containing protein
MPTRNVPVADAGPLVADVMLRDPRTVPAATTVAEAREALANPRERMLLVTRDGRFAGAVPRDRISDDLDDGLTLEALLDEETPRVTPEEPSRRALELLDADESERLPVVEADGSLVGLVCFNRRRNVFCVDG